MRPKRSQEGISQPGKGIPPGAGQGSGPAKYAGHIQSCGIAVSGECCLYGMWVDSGIFICIQQPCCGGDNVFLYRTIRTINDHKGGYNRYLKLRDLKKLSYKQLLSSFSELRKDGCGDGWAA